MGAGFPPFNGNTDQEVLKEVRGAVLKFPLPDFRDVSKEAKELIKMMLIKDPTKRASCEKLLSMRWVQEHAPTALDHTCAVGLLDNFRKFSNAGKFKKLAMTLIATQVND